MARDELSRPLYHQQPPLAERILLAVQDWLGRVFRSAGQFPGGWWGLVALAVVAVAVATVIFSWAGPPARARRRQDAPAPPRPRTSRDYRESAARLAAAGDYAAAICDGVRAIAAELDERAVLPPRAGRTADEFAHEAGLALPVHASGLRAAARLFDDVRYGDRAGTRHGYEQVRDLDLNVRAAAGRASRPAAAAAGGPR